MKLKLPIAVTELFAALPHRPPMVWVDEVLEAEATHGKARVSLRGDAAFSTGASVRPSAAMEWMAQTFGYVQAVYAHQAGTGEASVKRAFLASISDFKVRGDFSKAKAFTVTVDGFRPFGPLILFRGIVHDESGNLLAEARLKVFAERETS